MVRLRPVLSDTPFLKKESRAQAERDSAIMMAYRRADSRMTVGTGKRRRAPRVGHHGIVLESFKFGWRRNAVQIAPLERSVTVLLVLEYGCGTPCAGDVHHERFPAARFSVSVVLESRHVFQHSICI